jgi:hypothetical protein
MQNKKLHMESTFRYDFTLQRRDARRVGSFAHCGHNERLFHARIKLLLETLYLLYFIANRETVVFDVSESNRVIKLLLQLADEPPHSPDAAYIISLKSINGRFSVTFHHSASFAQMIVECPVTSVSKYFDSRCSIANFIAA